MTETATTDWAKYFRSRRMLMDAEKSAPGDPKHGEVRVVAKVAPADDPPKSAAGVVKYLSELGFHTEVMSHREEKYLRGEWHPQEVVHVTARMGKSAGWFRWIDGKPQECKVQVNGERPVWATMTAGKKLLLGAIP